QALVRRNQRSAAAVLARTLAHYREIQQTSNPSRRKSHGHTRTIAGLVCSCLLVLSACSSTDTGEPSTPQRSGSTEPSSSPKHGAPSVPEPLDVHSIVADPCSALTKEQVGKFPGTLDKTDVSKTTYQDEKKTTCRWIFKGDRYSYGAVGGGVVLPSETYQGLSSIYKARQEGSYEVFQPLELAGYPAVINGSKAETSGGGCRVSVGLRNDTAYRITVLLSTS